MECGQVVRHLALNEATVGSNPTTPAQYLCYRVTERARDSVKNFIKVIRI
jgi:hypothetical protein